MANEQLTKDIWEKLDVLGKLVSSVVLAAIAVFINLGAEEISTSLKTGQMVQSLITDLTAQKENTRQDIALIALNHSIGNEKPLLVSDIAERIYRDKEEAAVNADGRNSPGGIAFDIIKRRNPERAKQIEEDLKKQMIYLRTDLRSDASTTVSRQQAPTSQLFARTFSEIVYIQFKNEKNRTYAKQLQELCNAKGWFAPDIERVDASFTDGIRYYYPEDKLLAEKVATITNQFLKNIGENRSVLTKDLSHGKFKAKRGQVEVWINL